MWPRKCLLLACVLILVLLWLLCSYVHSPRKESLFWSLGFSEKNWIKREKKEGNLLTSKEDKRGLQMLDQGEGITRSLTPWLLLVGAAAAVLWYREWTQVKLHISVGMSELSGCNGRWVWCGVKGKQYQGSLLSLLHLEVEDGTFHSPIYPPFQTLTLVVNCNLWFAFHFCFKKSSPPFSLWFVAFLG